MPHGYLKLDEKPLYSAAQVKEAHLRLDRLYAALARAQLPADSPVATVIQKLKANFDTHEFIARACVYFVSYCIFAGSEAQWSSYFPAFSVCSLLRTLEQLDGMHSGSKLGVAIAFVLLAGCYSVYVQRASATKSKTDILGVMLGAEAYCTPSIRQC